MTNRSHTTVFLVAGLTLVTPATLFGQGRTLTLEDAISAALDNSPTIIQRQGDITVANASRREYIGDWLPNLSTNGGWSTNSSSRFDERTQTTVTGSSTSFSTGFSASYTLFDGFRRNATGRSTSAELTSAEANLVADEFQIILQTKQAYYQALTGVELAGVARLQIERAENQLRIAREKLAAGAAIRSDTLQSFVEVANARLSLVNAETQRANALATLQRLTGINDPITVAPDTMVTRMVPIDTVGLRDEALGSAPAILRAEAQVRVADANVAVAKAGYFPSITASYNNSFSGARVSQLNNSWSARLSFSWNLFNGFARETGVVRSSTQQESAMAGMEDTRRQTDAQMTQYLLALESARIRQQIAQASRVAAEENLRVQQERYRLGAATIVEVLQSQVSLDQAELDIVQSRLDYLTAKAQIETLIGREL